MAKFINKKEQVFDLKLTPYAKYMMSIGQFKPAFYAFYDDNVLYDKSYATASATETRNDINSRIKDDTQYIESLVLFRDVDKTLTQNADDSVDFVVKSATPRGRRPAADIFKMEYMIGDAFLDGPSQTAPSWKLATLNSRITSSATSDTTSDSKIPQINIEPTYVKKIVENDFIFDPENVRELASRTSGFFDRKAILLRSDDLMMYVEEVNTQTLHKNFDIEVFEVETSANSDSLPELRRLYFRDEIPNVQNGFMIADAPTPVLTRDITTDHVEYYFDVLVDENVNQRTACKGIELFNKDSYYVDIDFDCSEQEIESVFYDIYGATTTEPEICQS